MSELRGADTTAAGVPREEHLLPHPGDPQVGWTVFDPDDPERTTSVQAERLSALHKRKAVVLRQVHLTNCLVLRRDDSIPVAPVADGVLTDRRDLLAGVSAADCLPLFLIAPDACGVLHAGWRGVLGGILPLAIETLRHEFGVTLDHLRLYTGPGIGPCCFEVSTAVWSCFPPEARIRTEAALQLDLLRVVSEQWRACGGQAPAVHLGRCTVCGVPRLHSYRRDGGRGRNFAYLYFSGRRPEVHS